MNPITFARKRNHSHAITWIFSSTCLRISQLKRIVATTKAARSIFVRTGSKALFWRRIPKAPTTFCGSGWKWQTWLLVFSMRNKLLLSFIQSDASFKGWRYSYRYYKLRFCCHSDLYWTYRWWTLGDGASESRFRGTAVLFITAFQCGSDSNMQCLRFARSKSVSRLDACCWSSQVRNLAVQIRELWTFAVNGEIRCSIYVS